MLARTFLSARQLEISELDRQAAIKVLGMLERGEIKYVDVKYRRVQLHTRLGNITVKEPAPDGLGLNMAIWEEITDAKKYEHFCGCMGAWMERVKGRSLGDRCFEKFHDLFQPFGYNVAPQYYTPERCARALAAKLATGVADWSE